jgi:peptide chain release factor subunit 1
MDWFYVQDALLKTCHVFSIINSYGCVLIEPPKKIVKTFYACDKQFHLEPILEMFKNETVFGIVFIGGDSFYIFKIYKSGNHFESKEIYNDDIELAKRHKKGGQSQLRFSRLRQESIHNYITKVSEKVANLFLSNNNTKLSIEKLIIAGPADKKILLAQNDLIQQYFKNKIIIENTPELNDTTIHEFIAKSRKFFDINENIMDDQILDKINEMITFADDKLVFGIDEIIAELGHNNLCQIITDEKNGQIINLIKNKKCEILIVSSEKIKKNGLDIIGVKWY